MLRGYNLPGYTLALDDIEVYDGVYIIPNKGISYQEGLITINDYAVSLARIAEAVNDPAVFNYYAAENTAYCYEDLLIKSGAEFLISNGILKMQGGKHIRYEREAMLFLDNAEIVSVSSEPWYWQISGATHYAAIVLSVNNSRIDNCGGFTSTGMKCLYLKDSQFTNLAGSTPISISFRRPPNGSFLITGCLFQGKAGTETIFLQGGDQFHQLSPEPYGMDIIDTVFDGIRLFRHYEYPYYLSPGRPGGTASLVNVVVDSLGYNGSLYRLKYYLDVKVVDENNLPVSGATVTVVNQQDNIKYPAENLARSWKYLRVGDQVSAGGEDYFEGQQGNWFKGLIDVNNLAETMTGENGHTPPTSDTEGTLVLTDQRQDGTSVDNYTYTISAEKDGKTGQLMGVDPDASWYRSEPAMPAKSVVIVLGGQSYITNDAREPTITIISPRPGTLVSGEVCVKVNAFDSAGIAKVEFYINGIFKSQDTILPYEWVWNTEEYLQGEHEIRVEAQDNSNNTSETAVSVTVWKLKGLVAYPNPYIKGKNSGNRITFFNLLPGAVIRIYTLSGALVKNIRPEDWSTNNSAEWDISGMAGGVYIYSVASPAGQSKGKVSIVK